MNNKAPGTPPRPEGYETAGGAATNENFFHPKRKMTKSIQRAGFRSARRLMVCFSVVIGTIVIAPSYLGPFYVNYVAGKNWLERASKSIWTRRNEKDYDLYMTQRKNGWWEYLGLKHYNIGGETNVGEIQTYRSK
ncbi:uncharacterized protein TEOVI_000220900 [Trypanosoma equiperdum]|uniref:Uncharacterized protein n=4 Tax=Trypanozoon TaxID=39700 RepID=Q582V0_TRYB2|nr:hypothetical protein, conserved [Trypanosoma brucei gambiense DAL972]XP_843831.1 hypothetical protein, conserved [Trypanosoma brucei brucei TREU927]AAX80682.1 hypothetical protein, conserved [Trypanosoma brucei]RHW73590.1 hypothetical protein DPX39_030022700 [Trypanosoma brucei equiperdum]SCU70635.1 hypothetical protein, conserved [Trypanosoma equiperdum]AAZ10272.1 hypothetical protein, conserved [Trypanosoma brucei brucei TREU927]CBH09897.1 hypothetical protein, conserved [Trypanosoma bru|eukprot:XP_011772190.1 hypothetical protein, conserved [Trypanosoma brucei gambiense DAL972]